MILKDRVAAFEKLGFLFSDFNKIKSLDNYIMKSEMNNSWFSQSSIEYALLSLSYMLKPNQCLYLFYLIRRPYDWRPII